MNFKDAYRRMGANIASREGYVPRRPGWSNFTDDESALVMTVHADRINRDGMALRYTYGKEGPEVGMDHRQEFKRSMANIKKAYEENVPIRPIFIMSQSDEGHYDCDPRPHARLVVDRFGDDSVHFFLIAN